MANHQWFIIIRIFFNMDFYEGLFEELSKDVEIESLNISDELANYMVGNVYAQFGEEVHAATTLQILTGRFHTGVNNDFHFVISSGEVFQSTQYTELIHKLETKLPGGSFQGF